MYKSVDINNNSPKSSIFQEHEPKTYKKTLV